MGEPGGSAADESYQAEVGDGGWEEGVEGESAVGELVVCCVSC